MGGRKYRVPQIESYPLFNRWEDGTRCALPYGYTPYEVYSDLEVPDGTWVMERPQCGHTWLIGVDRDELQEVCIDKRPGQQRLLLLADRPFGFVQSAETQWLHDNRTLVPKGTRYLKYARQIHKGELGQGVPIPRVQFAREHPSQAYKAHDFARNRDQTRNPKRWARLGDVMSALDGSAPELITGYWPFIGTSYDVNKQCYGLLLHVRIGATRDEISSQKTPHDYLTFEETKEQITSKQGRNTTWIRAGLANTFLRLGALGYRPAATASIA